jgi:hypothetical protein
MFGAWHAYSRAKGPLLRGKKNRPYIVHLSRIYLLASIAFAACAKQDSVASKPVVATGHSVTSEPATLSANNGASEEVAAAAAPPPPNALVLTEDSATNPLAIVVAGIDTTVRLGAWLKSHPTDKVGEVPPAKEIEDKFCRASHLKLRLGNRTIVRSALFDIPEVPAGERYPSDTARVAEDLCELRTVWLSTEVPDSTSASALADTLAQLIDRKLGSHSTGVNLGAAGSANWLDGRSWKGPGTTVVVATLPSMAAERAFNSEDGPPPDSSPAYKTRRVVMTAYAPNSGFEDIDLLELRFQQRHKEPHVLYQNADSAIAWAGLPKIAADLQQVLAHARNIAGKGDTLTYPRIDEALLRAVKGTHDIAPTLSPPRRAAALLAADIVMFAAHPYFPSNAASPLRDSLESLGMTFTNLAIDQLVQNDRPWLWEAYRLDPSGRAGHAAFVELLGNGWTTKGACKEPGNEYDRIIEHGEADLRSGDTDPMVHFYLGSAYKTIFDASNVSPNDEYVDRRAYTAQAESARLRAIDHYRIALGSLTDRTVRKDVWNRVMRLLLGRSGEQPEYICFYD